MNSKILLYVLVFIVFTGFNLAKVVTQFGEVGKPYSLIIDKDQIFITEGTTIYIYSKKDFKLQKKFGKRGEGPKEFKSFATIYVLPDSLQINSMGKVSFYTRNGEFIKESRLKLGILELYPYGDQFLGIHNIEDMARYIAISIFDSKYQEKKRISKTKFFFQASRPGGNLDPIALAGPDGGCGSVPICRDKFFRENNGIFEAYDLVKNKIAYSFPLKIEKIKVTESDKNRYLNFFKKHPNTKERFDSLKKMFKFPEYFPLIRRSFIKDEKIYIRTYKIKDDKSEFYIFDIKGKLLKKLFLPIVEQNAIDKYPYTIHNNKIYQLVDNEDEEVWELNVFAIE